MSQSDKKADFIATYATAVVNYVQSTYKLNAKVEISYMHDCCMIYIAQGSQLFSKTLVTSLEFEQQDSRIYLLRDKLDSICKEAIQFFNPPLPPTEFSLEEIEAAKDAIMEMAE